METLPSEENPTRRSPANNAARALFIVACLTFAVWVFAPSGTPPAPTPEQPAKTSIDKSPKLQAERKALIEKAVSLEMFTKVERNGTTMPRVWTGKTFQTVTFDAKQNALSIVYAYYFDGTNPSASVAVIDGFTGNEIGRFDASGLHLK